MAEFVWSKVREMQFITNPVKNIFPRQFGDGAAWVSVGVGQKNRPIPVNIIAPGEGSTILLNILFEAGPRGGREDKDARHFVFRDFSPGGDGMRTPVDVISTQAPNLPPAEFPNVCEQQDGFVPLLEL